MAYMCSKCVWFHFVWKELRVCFYLRKEHGIHMHSFLKWETLIEFNRSFVWAGNSELGSMGDDFGFSGRNWRAYLPNFLPLSAALSGSDPRLCRSTIPCVTAGPSPSAAPSRVPPPPVQAGSAPHPTPLPTALVQCSVHACPCAVVPNFLRIYSLCEDQKVCGNYICG